jgi:glycolate oxidase
MDMPAPESAILDQRDSAIVALTGLVGRDYVVSASAQLSPYDTDALTAYRQKPMAVVLPGSIAEVQAVMAYCHAHQIKIVPRGAGTSLSGGALPLADGILLSLTRLSKIKDIDFENMCAVVEPGVTNLAITRAVESHGFYYAPDPSSQIACTIGGNVAENSGGVHCLKYGLTTNNLLGVKLVLMTGELIELGGKFFDAPGYDLLGIVTGSEGLLGVVVEVTVRLKRKPETARALLIGFDDVEKAGACVGDIISAGIIPAGLEMMDRIAIHAAEAFCHPGYPLNCEALLIAELDGPGAEVDDLVARVERIALAAGATSLKVSTSESERLQFWAGRKAAFPATGMVSPDFLCMDGTIPRGRLPEVLRGIAQLSQRFGLGVANVFHAGDGNLHPLILFDAGELDQLHRAEEFGAEILKLCVRVGGVLTGEHGVGIEKRDLMGEMFSEIDLAHQERLKCAFDPEGRLNPGKVFPVLHRCAELGKLHVHHGQMPHPDLPRF